MGLDNPLHIAFLLVILLVVFGAKRLPEMGRSLGEGLRGFRESISGENTTQQVVKQGDEHGADSRQVAAPELTAAVSEAQTADRASSIAHANELVRH